MFRTDLLSIIRSLNTVFTAIGICHTSRVDYASEVFTKTKLRNWASCWLLLQEHITAHGPLNVIINA